MILYPAIDLYGGQAVRLRQGNRQERTVYGNPVEIAARYRAEGAEWLHLVDLEAAFDGETRALPLIREIVRTFGGSVELGGGLRSLEAVSQRFELGVRRCIIGTAALEKPELVEEACRRWPGQIAVGIDAKNGNVALRGWVETASVTAVELAERVRNLGVNTIIYTDISKDGMMQGPNLPATQAMIRETGMEIIGSGGVSTLDDVKHLREIGCGGAILGKALYERAFTLPEALQLMGED